MLKHRHERPVLRTWDEEHKRDQAKADAQSLVVVLLLVAAACVAAGVWA